MDKFRWIAVLAVAGALAPLSVAAAEPAETTGTAGLKEFLPRSGEMPGFTPSGSIFVATTIARDVAEDDPANRQADASNLRADGFHEEVFQGQAGAGGKTGVVGVTELRSASAAAAYRKFDFGTLSTYGPVTGTTRQVRIARFPVPDVAGAEGATLISRTHVVADANVEWVQGDCVITVGDAVASHTALTKPLIDAAQAISRRTRAVCTA